ncbi:MAG: hypothetical protein NZ929_03730 [Aigarchaeota archaeon]|nr:hypothetical protein [Aigarchaeota archaeon]MCX8192808.1 hypothetical protein [Nitrososphaeria archaeon]MDW7986052.1 hypothetical protein [Nitrososphaerota archaeon]
MGVDHVVLLLDIDEEGSKKTIYLKKFLEGLVEKVDLTYWNELKKFKSIGLTAVESLSNILDRLVK